MTTQDLALFKGIGARMDYLNQRQKVLSQNIANADTPGYRPSDLKDVDFGQIMGKLNQENKLSPVATNAMHLPSVSAELNARPRDQKTSYEISPTGNGVVLEEQMVKEAQTNMDYNLMTSLYQKSKSMMKIAIGTSE